MASFGKVGKAAGIMLGAVVGLAGAGSFLALRRPLPQTSGKLSVAGLGAPVQVIRDRWGVPHIYAQNLVDLFMAQGYVHAQDRLWQIELQRRTGHGQLAEVFGPIALDTDRFLRVLGFSRVARHEVELLEGEASLAIDAYVRGINAYIARHARRLPIEFTILRLRPRPWQPADVLVWGKMMALNLSRSWTTDILRAQIVAAVGAERASLLEPEYLADHPLTIPAGVRYSADIGADALRIAGAVLPFARSDEGGQGSNAWAVSGARSTTGKPLLANDPHLMLQIPSLWYENHLSCGDYHVTGASIPGSPGVVIGHNEQIAWGMTNGENDVQDLFIERFDPADPSRYEFRGVWEQAQVVREEIVVRGQPKPVVEEIRITRHGPVITSLIPSDQRPPTIEDRGLKIEDSDASVDETRSSILYPLSSDHPSVADRRSSDSEELALRWTALDPGQIVKAVLALNRARDWTSFRAAVACWTVPTTNFVYADVEGHIGYAFGGDIPIRAKGDGRLPVPGWTGEYEWTGVIPHDQLPHMLDPEEGFVVTANNRIVGDDYPYPIPSEWLPGYRAARIRQLIEQTARHDARSFGRMHGDRRSLPGLELAALAGRLPAPTPTAQHARELLATWDGDLSAESVGGAIYARLREKLLFAVYGEVAGPLGTVTGLGGMASLPSNSYLWRALPQVLRRAADRDDSWLPGGRTWDDLLAGAWEATLAELRDEYSDEVSTWRYGRFHTLTLRHALGSIPALAPLLNRGPFPTGGDADTVWMGYSPRQYAGLPFYVAPSYRQICDTGNWDHSLSIHPVGQSGQPSSRHYADFVRPWLDIQYHPMLWSRMRVEEAAVGRMTLEPAA